MYAHRLVALYFLPNDNIKKTEVNHIDGDKTNNCVDNLEWVTPKQNQQHALQKELRKYNHVFCFNKQKKLVAEYINIQEASKATGISRSIIDQEVNKTIKTLSGGFYWSKVNELGEIKNYPNLGKNKPVYQYSMQGKFIKEYNSCGEAARALGLKNSSHIGECCRGKIKSYKGFLWRYVEDIVSPQNESLRNVCDT